MRDPPYAKVIVQYFLTEPSQQEVRDPGGEQVPGVAGVIPEEWPLHKDIAKSLGLKPPMVSDAIRVARDEIGQRYLGVARRRPKR